MQRSPPAWKRPSPRSTKPSPRPSPSGRRSCSASAGSPTPPSSNAPGASPTTCSARGLRVRRERAGLAGHESGQEHLALYLYNGNEYLEGMLGAFMARVAPLNVNYRYVEEELLYLFRNSGARAVVYHAEFAPRVAALRREIPELEVLLQVPDESGNALLPGALDYETALAAASPDAPGRGELRRRPLHPLHRRHHGHAEGRALALGGHLHGRHGRPAHRRAGARVARRGGGVRHRRGKMRAVIGPPLMHGAAQWASFITLGMGSAVDLPRRAAPLRSPRGADGDRAREGPHLHHRRRRLRPAAARSARRAELRPVEPLRDRLRGRAPLDGPQARVPRAHPPRDDHGLDRLLRDGGAGHQPEQSRHGRLDRGLPSAGGRGRRLRGPRPRARARRRRARLVRPARPRPPRLPRRRGEDRAHLPGDRGHALVGARATAPATGPTARSRCWGATR